MTSRHEFLEALHDTLNPRGYLEIGVLFGDSLRLAKCPAIGIDPAPHMRYHQPSARVYPMTSDYFFSQANEPTAAISATYQPALTNLDLAFIDGMHLYEFALRDFLNVERYANPRTVVVFDDVLPRNQHEAAREQCPGDWTGDVWKVPKLLQVYRKDLRLHWVNTTPTGTAVVYGFHDNPDNTIFPRLEVLRLEHLETVPDDVINREGAVEPEWALGQIATYMLELEE